MKIEERFWKFCSKFGKNLRIDLGECWSWNGSKNKAGYGQISVNCKPLLAHRVSWEMHFGAIPRGLQVLHKCDNPECCRPDHLFLGTHAENMRDMFSKGRRKTVALSGSRHGMTKLKEHDVRRIRSELLRGKSQASLAREYSVTLSAVHAISKGKTWKSCL